MSRWTRSLGVTATLTFAIAACGGGAPAESTSSSVDSSSSESSTAEASESAAAAGETIAPDASKGSSDGGPTASYARVTIGDKTWDFAPEEGSILERCDTDFFGGFWVLFLSGVEIVVPGDNWAAQGIDEPGRVEINVEDDTLNWIANPDSGLASLGVADGQSQIDSFTVNGNTVEGTATFVEANAVYVAQGSGIESSTGTFEAACVEAQ